MPPVGFEPKILAGERPAAAHLLRSWVRIPPGAWIFVCYECRVLSGRGLCDELITRPEESYRLCCVVVCDLETSRICTLYIYDISNLRVNNKTVVIVHLHSTSPGSSVISNLLGTTRPGFNSREGEIPFSPPRNYYQFWGPGSDVEL